MSVNQLIFNLDFQVVNRLLTSATTFCKAALSWVWQFAQVWRSYQTDYQFYGQCRVCLRRLHFWHMAIDTGHVVFAMNARVQVSYSGCCAFSIGVFDRELSSQRRQFCRNTAPYFRLSCLIPREFNRFVFAVEVILHMA